MSSDAMDDQQNVVDQDELTTQFIGITGSEEEVARNALEACQWNLELAINMFMESSLSQPSSADVSRPPMRSNSSAPVVESDPDEVRPPIAPVREVLVDDYRANFFPFNRDGNSDRPQPVSYDAFRNLEQESRWIEQQILDETQASSSDGRRTTLDDLFRPPLDLLYRGPFEHAKIEGQRQNKWLLVNVQNPLEFPCQVLNRDVWSNQAVKSIVREHFIFWQSYHNNPEGQKYINFYDVHSYPYVAIIDPRTGEKMFSWHETDTVTFCEKITQFLNEHPSPSGKKEDFATSSTTDESNNAASYDDSEEMQLKAAIEASLKDMESNGRDEEINCTEVKTEQDDWRNYLGPDDSNKVEIVIRFPNGSRDNVTLPAASKMKALFLYVSQSGYNMQNHDLITNFPKKNLSSCDENSTLESAGIHSRDTLYVQIKN